MDAQISISSSDRVEELADLSQWLRKERGMVGRVRPLQHPPREGELGGAADLLAVALSSGGTAAALASSLTAWVKTRRPDVAVTITTEAGTVTVSARDATTEDVLRLLDRALPGPDA